MRAATLASRNMYLVISALIWGLNVTGWAQSRYSQIVLAFPEERPFSYHYEPKDRALVLEFKNTRSDELEGLFNYDESIVQRALFKDMGGQLTEARLILKDENLKILVNTYQEPFRVSIDFFDPDYKESNDPTTGLPLAGHSERQDAPSEVPVAPQIVAPSNAPTSAKVAQQNNLSVPAGKRRLLQIQPDGIKTAQDMVSKLGEVNGGIGASWKTYPPYIARIQTANLKSAKSNEEWMRKAAEKALSSGEALAQYAGQLFDFGHESKALTLYQKLLQEEPGIFEKQAETIWKLAEIHLGQGNFSLADGYYESLTEKHKDHPLAAYAQLRRLDIAALKAIKEGKTDIFPGLTQSLFQIPTKASPGIEAQIALRNAYWGLPKEKLKATWADQNILPEISNEALTRIQTSRADAEGPKTAFLMDSIILSNRMLAEIWNPELAKYTGEYLNRYKGPATEPYRSTLLKNAESNILRKIDSLSQQKDYPQIIKLVDTLPSSLSELKKLSAVSWATAESLRQLKQDAAALPHYENSIAGAKTKIDQFRNQFILSQVSSNAWKAASAKGNAERSQQYQNKLKQADSKTWDIWQTLNPSEKNLVFSEHKDDFELQLQQEQLTKSSPLILLEVLGQKLGTEAPSSGAAVNAKDSSVMPTERMIPLLTNLANRFDKLGMSNEKRKAKKAMAYLDLKGQKIDKSMMKIWTDEVTALAEELRQENNFLEAGRLYTQAGSSNNQWEGRAEALYKGGLLLFRAGRRDEAINAFKQAASDGSNLLYADLAKERLEQLK